MPDCAGFTVAESMRGTTRFANIRIVAHTSLAEAEVIDHGKAVEMTRFTARARPYTACSAKSTMLRRREQCNHAAIHLLGLAISLKLKSVPWPRHRTGRRAPRCCPSPGAHAACRDDGTSTAKRI